MTMLYSYPPLVPGLLLRRYKRFLADVAIEGGKTVTVFCPNSGSMMGLVEPGTPAMLSPAGNPARKTCYTLEMLRPGSTWVGVNTLLTNRLAETLIEKGLVSPSLTGFDRMVREVPAGESRLDIMVTRENRRIYIEVKSVTLRVGEEARFPDAVTLRGRRHLETLIRLKREGHGACMLYLVQRGDCSCFAPARDIDPAYAETFGRAVDSGVEIFTAGLDVRPEGVSHGGAVPLCG